MWGLAWPLILSSVSVPMLGVVDTAVMGHMPDPAYLGAVAIGALIFDFIYWAFGFLRMGTTGFTARAFGAQDQLGLRLAVLRPLGLAVLIGGTLWILQAPIAGVAFALIEAGPEVAPLSRDYYAIRIWAAPAVLANYAILGWLLGVQRPKLALLTTLVANGLNVVLDLSFVLGFGWGVKGVALASVLAQVGALAAGLVIVRSVAGPLKAPWAGLIERDGLGELWRVNRDIFVRTLGLMSAFAWFTAQGAAQGKLILAANAVLWNLQMLMSYANDGFAHAAEVLVGEAMGRRDGPALRAAVYSTLRFSAAIALAFTLAWWLGGPHAIDALTDLEEVRRVARVYLPWAIALPLLSVWSFQLDGMCIGAMHTRAMRDGMLVSLAGFVALGVWLQEAYGNHGLWAAFMGFMVLRCLTLLPAGRSILQLRE